MCIEAGLDSEPGSGDVVGDEVGFGGVVVGEDAEIQVGSEVQVLTVVWEELPGCAAIVGW